MARRSSRPGSRIDVSVRLHPSDVDTTVWESQIALERTMDRRYSDMRDVRWFVHPRRGLVLAFTARNPAIKPCQPIRFRQHEWIAYSR
jgi:hypothetical protein